MRKYLYASLLILMSAPALAQEAAAGGGSSSSGMIAIAIGIMMGLAPLGGAIGQGMAASAALDGIARNPAAQPKLFVPMIIALALIESLVIYALVIAFQLSGKV